jgi:hypothetical protein
MVKLLAVFCAALFSCLAIASASASASATTADQSPPHFTVQLRSVAGSGCPHGSTAVSKASDAIFTITYDQYIAAAGGGASPGNFRKNCQLNVDVGVPAGWTYGIAAVDYRGYAHLGGGAHGTLAASYYFGGVSGTSRQNHSLPGPADSDYEFDDQAPAVTYAPCRFHTTLNINTALSVYRGSDPSFFNMLTVDSTDVNMTTVYQLTFQQC